MSEPDGRPDPDVLLERVNAEAAMAARARLKVFLGYAPGVGKTYTMLESARRLRADGIDVVVGVVETHGRTETAALVEGLEVLSRRQLTYRGVQQTEFDLDAALARRPKLILLDELAHTNVPGSRHAKRWQDTLELLDAGIDVHTTLNIQHVDSLNDVIAQITFVQVRETVPDSILERADEIELVDLTPDELLGRLREGKVYVPEQARRAADRFFRRGNLLALRELALRRAAERVDADVVAYRREHEVRTTWPAAERILVCVGPSPSSERLIRAARRMAAGLRAPWVAAYVHRTQAFPAKAADAERLQAHLRLAESLGGEAVRLSGSRVPEELLRYARERNITRIIIGKPGHPRWRDLLRGSLVNDLVRGSGEIEVHFVRGDEGAPDHRQETPEVRAGVPWTGFLLALALVAGVTGIALTLRSFVSLPDVVVLYLVVIMIAAFGPGRGPAVVAAAVSVLSYDFFFVPPYYALSVADARHILTFGMMFAVGIAVSGLTGRLRRQELESRRREGRTSSLYSLSRELLPVTDVGAAAAIASRHAAGVFGGDAAVLVRDSADALVVAGRSTEGFELDVEELAVARWAAEHGRPAGFGTDTLGGARVACVPLKAGGNPLGVLALRRVSLEAMDVEHRRFLEAFVRQVSLAVEHAALTEEARATALKARSDEVRSSLLHAVSHDLRTPLAAITGSASTLREEDAKLSPEQRRDLLDTLCVEAERMERLVANILDMVRIDSGGMSPRREWVPLEKVVGSALERLSRRLEGRQVSLRLPRDLPLLHADPALLEQVFLNLVENAATYTAPGVAIEIEARTVEGGVEIDVADRGPGIPAGDEERIFEKFFRGPQAGVGGVGLGLPICRAIVTAHGGTLSAENRPGGGALFRIHLKGIGAPLSVLPKAGP